MVQPDRSCRSPQAGTFLGRLVAGIRFVVLENARRRKDVKRAHDVDIDQGACALQVRERQAQGLAARQSDASIRLKENYRDGFAGSRSALVGRHADLAVSRDSKCEDGFQRDTQIDRCPGLSGIIDGEHRSEPLGKDEATSNVHSPPASSR